MQRVWYGVDHWDSIVSIDNLYLFFCPGWKICNKPLGFCVSVLSPRDSPQDIISIGGWEGLYEIPSC